MTRRHQDNRPAPRPSERFLYDYGKGEQWRSLRLRVALGFPAPYSVGMSNLAFLWVFHLMNREPGVRCDRFFMPEPGSESHARTATLETGRLISEYDVVAFSLPFEPDYLNVVSLLARGGVEPVAEKRRACPFVIAGGVAVGANPEPVAAFLDAVVAGDAEPVLPALLETLRHARAARVRSEMLHALAALPGVYVPALYDVEYAHDGTIARRTPRPGAPDTVRAARLEKLDEPAHAPVVSDGAAFKDMFLLELSRGCPYTCRFCLTRYTGHGFRAAPAPALASLVAAGAGVAGRIGFVGTAFSDAAAMDATCRAAAQTGARVSFSSLRLTDRVLELFRNWGAVIDNQTLTVAPEAATPRMRRVLDKDLEQPLDRFLDCAFPERTHAVKMYYLVGAPGERDQDAAAIADQARGAQKRLAARNVRLSLSVNPMVAKAHTPMQWTAMPDRAALRARLAGLKKSLAAGPRIPVSGMGAREAEIQTVLSLGDRRLAPVIAHAAAQGASRSAWVQGLNDNGLCLDFYARRERAEQEILPWDVIDHGVPRDKLYAQYRDILDCARDI